MIVLPSDRTCVMIISKTMAGNNDNSNVGESNVEGRKVRVEIDDGGRGWEAENRSESACEMSAEKITL